MKNNITELVCILDRSGSMAGLESDTVGGFNALIEKQRREDGLCYVSTILFNNESTVLHDRVPLEQVRAMAPGDYVPGGCTALLDAIGGAIRHIGNIHKYARPEDVPEHTVFVITTDGMENASRRYGYGEVKTMLERQKEEHGWEFLFLAANIDAAETAASIGISRDRAANYRSDGAGTELMYSVAAEAVSAMRCGAAMRKGWADKLNRDARRR
ncbi:MAG: VWA domain-containing protein [Oscillospiraceae bacterium]|nr:VWA domain-containing protein [Oscillospiraceae bacterium]